MPEKPLPDDDETRLLAELEECFEQKLAGMLELAQPARSVSVWPTYQKMAENVERLRFECYSIRLQLLAVRRAKREAREAKPTCAACRTLAKALQDVVAEQVKVERELFEAAIVREDPIAASEAKAKVNEFLRKSIEVRVKCEIHRLSEHDEVWTPEMIPVV